MFNKEFFPTPRSVIERMGIDCQDKICLEPSAGKGDIVSYLKEFGAKQVLACEQNDDLRKIVSGKANVIASDFFTVSGPDISHVNLIVMNPPFSNASKHILHAWQIAAEGCEIIALCNWQTLYNDRGYSRSELAELVNNYGSKENLGDCFSAAERKTNVEIGLIHLFKPVVSQEFDFDGFYYTDDDQAGANGIMPYNEIRAIVNSYVAAVKCFDRFRAIADEMNSYTKMTGFGSGFTFNVGYKETICDKESFAKSMQIHCWKHVFDKLNIEKFVTSGVMQDINRFIQSQQAYPFTMRNIYRMIDIIVGTRDQIMNRAIVEAIDNFTRHTHENRYGVEGWKTNEGHLLNAKFIVNRIADCNYGLRIRNWNCQNYDHIKDLVKAICYVVGIDYANIPAIESASGELQTSEYNRFTPNQWYDWGFFQFKVFKKGTGHFKFKDIKVWEQLNRAYAKAKGNVLPEKF